MNDTVKNVSYIEYESCGSDEILGPDSNSKPSSNNIFFSSSQMADQHDDEIRIDTERRELIRNQIDRFLPECNSFLDSCQ